MSGRSGIPTLSEYSNGGVTAKIKTGEANWFQVKLFDDSRSVVLYEGYNEDEARAVWSMVSRLVS